MEITLTQAIADYIEQRKQAKLESLQKALNKVLDKSDNQAEIAQAQIDYKEKAQPIEESFKPVNWLTDAARRAKQISLATHAAKFTHSDAKASSVLLNQAEIDEYGYLTTASLSTLSIDAVGNAAALDIAKLLKLEVNGETLVLQLQQGKATALAPFSISEDQLNNWVTGFKLALGDEKLSFHTLNKQVYFPVASEEQNYHLLCPLYSSSLAHQFHQMITSTRFGDSKEIRDARKAEKFHKNLDISFPKTAIQTMGGSKPQNISQLNSERYGQNYLLNAAPPTYQKQTASPKTSTTIFNRQFTYKVSGYIREFKAFLVALKPDERNFKVRYKRDFYFINPIVEQLMNFVASIQLMESGWALDEDCKLKQEHALWLDVYNQNQAFQREREKLDWQKVIAKDFALWLAKQLENNDKYLLADIEKAYFAKLCLKQLKDFERATPKFLTKGSDK